MNADTILIRPCQDLEELDACVQVQSDVWGWADRDLVPRRVFIVAQKVGGQVIGAFDGGNLVVRPRYPRHLPRAALSALPRCSGSTLVIATAASAGGSSCLNGMRRWREGSRACNGPSTTRDQEQLSKPG